MKLSHKVEVDRQRLELSQAKGVVSVDNDTTIVVEDGASSGAGYTICDGFPGGT